MGLTAGSVKLLLDENLSRRLIDRLEAVYPGSTHVVDVGLGGHPDQEIWEFAKAQSMVIVSKDSDFADMSILRGHPPKVVMLRLGNAGTSQIKDILIESRSALELLAADDTVSLLDLPVVSR